MVRQADLSHGWLAAVRAAAASRHRRLTPPSPSRRRRRRRRELLPGGKYFFTRNMSTLVAFAVGGKVVPGAGFTVVGAHTDSPCPKLKPISKLTKGGYLQLSVAGYGGGLWHTWYDRDLSIAGRVIVQKEGEPPKHQVRQAGTSLSPSPSRWPVAQRLCAVRSWSASRSQSSASRRSPSTWRERTVCAPSAFSNVQTATLQVARTPTTVRDVTLLAGTVNGFKFNLQSNFPPLLATAAKDALMGPEWKPKEGEYDAGASLSKTGAEKHHPLLLTMLAEELGCEAAEIADFELQLCDTQPAQLGGALDEFIFSGRLDNLANCYCSLRALIESSGSLASEPHVRVKKRLFLEDQIGCLISASSSSGYC